MLDDGGGIDVVYLDFRKAFDSVPHQRLLKKFKAHEIGGSRSLLQWIESFLTGRKQRVCESHHGWKYTVGYHKAVFLDQSYLLCSSMTYRM